MTKIVTNGERFFHRINGRWREVDLDRWLRVKLAMSADVATGAAALWEGCAFLLVERPLPAADRRAS